MNRTVEQLCDDILERLSMMPGPEIKQTECLTDEVEKRGPTSVYETVEPDLLEGCGSSKERGIGNSDAGRSEDTLVCSSFSGKEKTYGPYDGEMMH